jgi:hypothetical protein
LSYDNFKNNSISRDASNALTPLHLYYVTPYPNNDCDRLRRSFVFSKAVSLFVKYDFAIRQKTNTSGKKGKRVYYLFASFSPKYLPQ